MSTLLYALGRWAIRAKTLVLILWIAVLALLGAGAGLFGQGANAPITIPGTESQEAITELGRTFPEVSGTSATIIVVAADGERVDDAAYEQIISDAAADLEDVRDVTAVQTPFSELAGGGLADDGSAALITVQVEGDMSTVPDATVEGIERATEEIRDQLPQGAQASYGGEMFSAAVPGISPTEAIGVLVAFVVLILTLGSLIAAGMPLLIAILGVGVSIAGLFLVTAFADLTSTTPMLALMLGLAVGIDYTLFIVSRHQEQLRAGLGVEESIARATATSGSAVVFAGLTVIIALVGLAVAGIPFLTALGVAAAAAVAIAVLIAITLTPAVMAMAGMRILPKKQRSVVLREERGAESSRVDPATRKLAQDDGETPHAQDDGETPHAPSRADRFFAGWVRTVTRRPIITIAAVLVALGLAAVPALDLRLALPNATSLPADDPARVTYELTGEHFGEGHNGPLLLTGSIITSEDPLGLMEDLADEVRQVPGVAEVPLATPNQGADTGIIQVVPEEGPHAESTAQLVHELRELHDVWQEEYGVSLAVTGFTAVGIDVSEMLMQALLPFGILVVGLSLILLAMVFRSVWVPVKATLGYLLSVGAAFGAVVAVFQWGWFADLLHVSAAGPVLSFMPIILMGVLFGLAMDYEVFLVSRIREEYVHGATARDAIRRGFVGSAKVVTAAALIMFAVFAAFVPEGDPSIKVIALGLAVGVFVDAFIVRMTLVPAVLALLGDRAWWMPRWLSRLLPAFDVEGEGLSREIAHAEWPDDLPRAAIAAERLLLPHHVRVPRLRVAAGEVLLLDPRDPASLPLAETLTGRGPIIAGTVKVDGLLLPERSASLRARSAWCGPESLREALRDRPSVLLLDLRDAAERPMTLDRVDDVRSALAAATVETSRGSAPELAIVVLGGRDLAERLLPADARFVEPDADPGADDPAPADASPADPAQTLEGAAR
ncbi:MMPL family transporter [Leucobacter triazinivorans]|uniref:MMPL family transporter n=1 Tax=Leucobacter triazinivorans TaxID=1784719 RepID=A0A4P6KGB6_9MICO|nr:MMPL family transporter [Leucobacter triazinivorans]QBE49081.1 MMPL family transporter [Leucobacter triazinivorans]